MENELHDQEIWKPVRFAGLKRGEKYEISNFGRLRYYYTDENEWKVMKITNSSADGTGYMYFTWFKSSKGWKHRITKPIHRLVAEAFCERSTVDHKYVIHIDYVKTNNHFSNLKWVDKQGLSDHTHSPYVQAKKNKKNESKVKGEDTLSVKEN
jgi:hypothetical protein